MRHPEVFIRRVFLASVWIVVALVGVSYMYFDTVGRMVMSPYTVPFWQVSMITVAILLLATIFSVVGLPSVRKAWRSFKWWRLRDKALRTRYVQNRDVVDRLARISKAYARLSAERTPNIYLMDRLMRRYRIVRSVATEQGIIVPSFGELIEVAGTDAIREHSRPKVA